jgi:hypothetical protein
MRYRRCDQMSCVESKEWSRHEKGSSESNRSMQDDAVRERFCAVRCSYKSFGINALILADGDGSFVKYCELCPADISGAVPLLPIKETSF